MVWWLSIMSESLTIAPHRPGLYRVCGRSILYIEITYFVIVSWIE